MTKHSWHIDPEYPFDILDEHGLDVATTMTPGGTGVHENAAEHAAFIVRAVNSHIENERVIVALRAALEQFVSLCPSAEGLGGFAPHGAFQIAAAAGRRALAAAKENA